MTVRVITGNVLGRLADLPDERVHCVVMTQPVVPAVRALGAT